MSPYIPDEFGETNVVPLGRGDVMVPLGPGDVLSRQYRLDRILGQGGMGIVWLARNMHFDDHPAAIKVLLPVYARNVRAIARLKYEAKKCLELNHDHIVRLHTFGQDHDRPGGSIAYLAMEYVNGPTLDGLLGEHRAGLPWDRVRPWADQLAAAIDYAHVRGVLHRDIKPANIMIRNEGRGSACLMDFGIAREMRETMSTITGRFADGSGTLPYMSPQQFVGEEDSKSNDVYAFAMTLYEVLSGAPAFRSGGSAEALIWKIRNAPPAPLKNVPPAVNAAILRGLAKESEDRPGSCVELVDEARGQGKGDAVSGAKSSVRPPSDKASSSSSASARQPGDVLTVLIGRNRDTEMRFRWIPAGSFVMGSPDSEAERFADEGPQRRVTFARGFWLAETPVTQGQWKAVKGRENNPSGFKGDDRLPVETVSWEDAQTYIAKLNGFGLGARAGSSGGVRLPSEAEWEYACRAGTTTPFHFGDTISTDQANYNGNFTYGRGRKGVYRKKTTVVGSFPANAWGLHDMHGNVWEWCEDVYRDSYAGAPTDGSAMKQGQDNGSRVLRGGSWYGYPRDLRSAYRNRYAPDSRYYSFGFRLALDSD